VREEEGFGTVVEVRGRVDFVEAREEVEELGLKVSMG
jgi:hypothetical protein